jgi:Family of unknown function (DUF6869)
MGCSSIRLKANAARSVMPQRQTDVSRKKVISLAHDWAHYQGLPGRERERGPYFRAMVRLAELVRDDPELAWPVILEIPRIDASDMMLANVAAGPLEDLLVNHGSEFIERVEALAKIDPVFRKMLGAVWKNNISDDIWARLKVVAGPTF